MPVSFLAEGIQDTLACPACGGGNLHHGMVTVYSRGEDALKTDITSVRASGAVLTLKLDSHETENPSPRRHGMAVKFTCETCDALPVLTLFQHKGSTYVEWRRE